MCLWLCLAPNSIWSRLGKDCGFGKSEKRLEATETNNWNHDLSVPKGFCCLNLTTSKTQDVKPGLAMTCIRYKNVARLLPNKMLPLNTVKTAIVFQIKQKSKNIYLFRGWHTTLDAAWPPILERHRSLCAKSLERTK